MSLAGQNIIRVKNALATLPFPRLWPPDHPATDHRAYGISVITPVMHYSCTLLECPRAVRSRATRKAKNKEWTGREITWKIPQRTKKKEKNNAFFFFSFYRHLAPSPPPTCGAPLSAHTLDGARSAGHRIFFSRNFSQDIVFARIQT